MPPTRIAVAAFGIVVLALALASERMLPAHGDALLVASAHASVQPVVASPGLRASSGRHLTASISRTATSADPGQSAPDGAALAPTATPER